MADGPVVGGTGLTVLRGAALAREGLASEMGLVARTRKDDLLNDISASVASGSTVTLVIFTGRAVSSWRGAVRP